MRSVFTIILVVLVLLAVWSGISKLLLMQQEVNFYMRLGFSRFMLMFFGLIQVLGGLLMAFARTRFVGAAVVAVTFLVSFVMLLNDGNLVIAILTGFAMLLLAVVMKQSRRTNPK